MGENSEHRKFPLMIIKYHQSSCFYSNDFNYHNYHVNWRWTPHVWINPSHRKIRMAELHQVYSGHKCQTLRVVTLHLNGTWHIAPQQMSFIACSFLFSEEFQYVPVLLRTWNECEALPSIQNQGESTQETSKLNAQNAVQYHHDAATKPATSLRSSCSDILARCGLLWHSSHTMWGKCNLQMKRTLDYIE